MDRNSTGHGLVTRAASLVKVKKLNWKTYLKRFCRGPVGGVLLNVLEHTFYGCTAAESWSGLQNLLRTLHIKKDAMHTGIPKCHGYPAVKVLTDYMHLTQKMVQFLISPDLHGWICRKTGLQTD